MAMVVKTMEEIKKKITDDAIEAMCKRLDNHIDEYDAENPPMTKEELDEIHKIAEKRRTARKSVLLSA
ncbi:MAG: hypothetical protein J6I62_10125 [Selenomonadaceae bacterium]|nr:hypothetical protein [Selenomonadaceae bacterium]